MVHGRIKASAAIFRFFEINWFLVFFAYPVVLGDFVGGAGHWARRLTANFEHLGLVLLEHMSAVCV